MILLDTHVVIWLMNAPERVSKAAVSAIAATGAQGQLPGVSVASLFELIYTRQRGRIQLHASDAEILQRMRAWFDIRPIAESIAIQAASLPDPFHGDPMDRLIAATALVEQRTLITADRRIHACRVCKTLW